MRVAHGDRPVDTVGGCGDFGERGACSPRGDGGAVSTCRTRVRGVGAAFFDCAIAVSAAVVKARRRPGDFDASRVRVRTSLPAADGDLVARLLEARGLSGDFRRGIATFVTLLVDNVCT